MADRTLTVDYVPLDSVKEARRNPKMHDLPAIRASFDRFGLGDLAGIVDGKTGRLVAGHGRMTVLRELVAEGAKPPAGVKVDGDGTWLVPILSGVRFRNTAEAEAFLLGHNRTTELGGWDSDQLELMAPDLDLSGTGFTADDFGNVEDDDGAYSQHADVPHYVPTLPDPPPVAALVDTTVRDRLIEQIDATDGLPDDVRTFLTAGAQRHLRFNYSQVAEFYAHADPDVQKLMEESLLVIVDIDDALRGGFVRLHSTMEDLAETQRQEDAARKAGP